MTMHVHLLSIEPLLAKASQGAKKVGWRMC